MRFINNKLHLVSLCLMTILFLGIHSTVNAQEESSKESKKVVIITKKVDKDGKETIEKIVREGEEIDNEEIDRIIEKAKKEGGEIDVQIEKKEKRIIKQQKDGKTKNIWIEKDGEEIGLDKIEGDGVMIFKTDDGKIIKLDGEDLHEEHIMIEEDANTEKNVEVTVTVDEEGNTTRIEKRIVKQKKVADEMEVTVSIDEDGNTKIIKKRKKARDVEAKLKEMGIELPILGKPVANYVHAVTSNNWVFLAGKGPRKADGKNIVGKLGKDLTVEQGYEAAKWAGINLLAALKGEIGDLNRVVRIVKVKGMVNAIAEFTDHSKVINGFSDLMVEVFGDKGKHARAAVGMSSLPGNMAVEIEVVVEIE